MQKQIQILVVGFPAPKGRISKQVRYVGLEDVRPSDIGLNVSYIFLPLSSQIDATIKNHILDMARIQGVPNVVYVYDPTTLVDALIFGKHHESLDETEEEDAPERFKGEPWHTYVARVAPREGDINEVAEQVNRWAHSQGYLMAKSEVKLALLRLHKAKEASFINLQRKMKSKPVKRRIASYD